jgi:GNAT superfamily N-acetyltransferase
MNGQVSETELDELEWIYHSRNAPAEIVVCPLADASLFALLAARGYRIKEFENELVLCLSDWQASASESSESDTEIRQAEESDADSWTRIIAQGFFDASTASDESLTTFRAMFRVERAAAFLASIDGQPVGGGGLWTHEGVACLVGTSTLTEYRNRGVHTALIRARLESAASLGCDLAKVTTQPGSGSQRNVERHGFRVAYTRVVMMRGN